MVRNAYKMAEPQGPQRPQRTPAAAYYLLQDLPYRGVALTNSGGYIVEAYDNDAYGNTLIFIEPGSDGRWFTDDDVQADYGANEIIYCGYRFDPETQIYYVRNRTYNPVLGRWIQRDPIGYSGGINLYAYVDSSPAGAADRSGNSRDNYVPDRSGKHGGPHVDRYSPGRQNVGRYRPDGTPIPHGGICPEPIPNSDKKKFKDAVEKLGKGAVVVGTGAAIGVGVVWVIENIVPYFVLAF